jgi:hypothetical protein
MAVIPVGFRPVELAGDWPPGAPLGIFACRRNEDGALVIDYADPRLVISAQVVEGIVCGDLPEATLTHADYTRPGGHAGALLKFRASNRTVIYRLTEWLPSIRAYIGEWPE